MKLHIWLITQQSGSQTGGNVDQVPEQIPELLYVNRNRVKERLTDKTKKKQKQDKVREDPMEASWDGRICICVNVCVCVWV